MLSKLILTLKDPYDSSIGFELEILFLSLIGQQVLFKVKVLAVIQFSSIENSLHLSIILKLKHIITIQVQKLLRQDEDNWIVFIFELGYYDKKLNYYLENGSILNYLKQ